MINEYFLLYFGIVTVSVMGLYFINDLLEE
jgi:hypothetical protein